MEIVQRKRKKSSVGRKEYKPSTNDYTQAYTYYQRGFTDKQIAEKINISETTYKRKKELFIKYYARREERKSAEIELIERDRAIYAPKYRYFQDLPLDLIRSLVLAKFSEKDIAACLHISYDTYLRYKKKFPELRKLIETSELCAIANVVSSLHMRANGCKVPAVHFASYMGEIRHKEYDKYILPDIGAIQTVLYNSKLADFNREGTQGTTTAKGQILEALEYLSSEESVSFTEDEAKPSSNYNEHFSSESIEAGDYTEVKE